VRHYMSGLRIVLASASIRGLKGDQAGFTPILSPSPLVAPVVSRSRVSRSDVADRMLA